MDFLFQKRPNLKITEGMDITNAFTISVFWLIMLPFVRAWLTSLMLFHFRQIDFSLLDLYVTVVLMQ